MNYLQAQKIGQAQKLFPSQKGWKDTLKELKN